jgi:acyl transferase domain-containing protein
MSGLLGRLSSLSRKRLELLALDLQERLQRSEGTGREPIAIVGAACRFPGAPDLDAYWSLLAHGRDAVTDIPSDRWDVERHYSPDPDAPGKMYTRRGCFIDQPTRFDAAFFSISAREARAMDPQQRLLLETTWHALEHALIPPAILAGSRTGVFMGVSTTDYLQYSARTFELEQMDAYIGTGCAASVASGRLSYVLGLQGPSLPVDTACSSSLVAVHLACQSLNTGESDLALAGGVNLMLVQDTFIYFSRLRALAPDGRCKTFDATADGYGRGEGCGVLVLKRLSDALADGDDVLAIIRGSAVNHDGRSNGLTVPSGLAQEGVARDALRSAGVSATEIGYVEAHGTGTALGDPIELHAIGAVHKGRAAPLLVGSAKTNIGHLEAAAGVAGLLKLALMLRHRQVAPHLNLRLPNPYVDWANIPVEVACGKRSFPAPEGRLLGGVSSFGFGGTNAHVVLEAAEPRPPAERADRPERSQHLLCVSARSENALKQLAGTVALAAAETPSLADLCWSANAGRAHHEHRLILSAGDGAEAAHALDEWRAGREAPVGHAKGGSSPRPTVAFLFSGQGAQYAGMGRALYESEPLFRETIDECEKLLATEIDAPLREVLWGSATDLLDRTDHTQPALFAIEAALGRLWLSWGIVPRVALGHSVGEYSAAHMGGMFGLADGLALVAARGRLMQRLCPPGAMLALDCDEATAAKLIAGHEDMVAIAAVNGPASTVISGYPERIVAIRDTAGPLRTHPLTVSHAFHSPLMEPMLAAFAEVVAKIDFRRPAWTIISNVTGREARADELIDPGYWVRHVREPVRFAASLAASLDLGVDTMIEVGPKPVLLGMARASVPAGTRRSPTKGAFTRRCVRSISPEPRSTGAVSTGRSSGAGPRCPFIRSAERSIGPSRRPGSRPPRRPRPGPLFPTRTSPRTVTAPRNGSTASTGSPRGRPRLQPSQAGSSCFSATSAASVRPWRRRCARADAKLSWHGAAARSAKTATGSSCSVPATGAITTGCSIGLAPRLRSFTCGVSTAGAAKPTRWPPRQAASSRR